jgi:hypothetical protein
LFTILAAEVLENFNTCCLEKIPRMRELGKVRKTTQAEGEGSFREEFLKGQAQYC